MKKCLVLSLMAAMLAGCHSRVHLHAMSPSKVQTYQDFEELFPVLVLPYRLGEDTLTRMEPDSTAIPGDILSRFFPDTLGKGIFKKGDGLQYFALGQIQDKKLTYLFLKVTGLHFRGGLLCLFDENGKFLSTLLAGKVPEKGENTLITTQLDKQFNITVSRERTLGPGKAELREDVYGANPNGTLSLILVNSNEPTNPQQLYNPIDSLPKAHKYSGDYTAGRMNLVSIRDTRKAVDFRFFIHFSKDEGNCTGEIDGTATWNSAGLGQYHEEHGACGIQFKFTDDKVTLEETGNCGSYRGMSCKFSGSFEKKKARKLKRTSGHRG